MAEAGCASPEQIGTDRGDAPFSQIGFHALHGGRPDCCCRGDGGILGKHHVPALQFAVGLAMLEGRTCPSSGPAPQTALATGLDGWAGTGVCWSSATKVSCSSCHNKK